MCVHLLGQRDEPTEARILDAFLDPEEAQPAGQDQDQAEPGDGAGQPPASRFLSPPAAEPLVRSFASRERGFQMSSVQIWRRRHRPRHP